MALQPIKGEAGQFPQFQLAAAAKFPVRGLLRVMWLSRPSAVMWRAVTGRPRLFIGLAAGLAAVPFLPADTALMTRAILSWDISVIVYLTLAAILFTTERTDRIAADAAAQEEGEWTIFWLTVATVVFSFAAIFSEFADIKSLPSGQKSLHVLLVSLTLLSSWLITHVTFAFRYAHEYHMGRIKAAQNSMEVWIFPGKSIPIIWILCISRWCWE